jgi:SAM-dependent methyltransferase
MDSISNLPKDSRVNQNVVLENFEFTTLDAAKNYRRALMSSLTPYLQGDVIEIGAGIGQMTILLKKIAAIKFLQCVEPSPQFCQQFKGFLPNQPLVQGTIYDVQKKDWDTIVSINVLEHIEDDAGELSAYHELLKNRKGLFCLFVPARPEIYAPIDKDVGHFRRYTKKSITTKLNNAGFEIEHIRYYNFVGYFAWWFSFRFLKQRSFNIHAVRLFDSIIFPPTHFIETYICRAPIGQSLFVIASAK